MDGKLLEEFLELKLKVQQLEERLRALENANQDTGVYINGSPEYVRNYLKEKREKEAQKSQGGSI